MQRHSGSTTQAKECARVQEGYGANVNGGAGQVLPRLRHYEKGLGTKRVPPD